MQSARLRPASTLLRRRTSRRRGGGKATFVALVLALVAMTLLALTLHVASLAPNDAPIMIAALAPIAPIF